MVRVMTIAGEQLDLRPGMTLTKAMLRDLALDGVDLHGSDLAGSFFNESSLIGTDLSGCDLSDCVFFRANLSGADLSGAIVSGAYWNEVRYSSTTRWPDGFEPPARPDALAELSLEDILWERRSGLCDPGLADGSFRFQESAPARSLIDPSVLASISADERRLLVFVRLAMNVFATARLVDADECIFSNPAVQSGDLDVDHDEFMFTATVLLLLALDLRVESVNDDGSVLVTMHPDPDMSRLVMSDPFRLFVRLLGFENGDEVDPDMSVRESVRTCAAGRSTIGLLPGPGTHPDVHGAPPQDAVVASVVAFLRAIDASTLWSVADGEDMEAEPVEDDEVWPDGAALVLGALGFSTATWRGDGYVSATLRPPVDIAEFLVTQEVMTEDPDPVVVRQLASARPRLGVWREIIANR